MRDLHRDQLLRQTHALWNASCGTMRYMKVSAPDYLAVSELSAALCIFAMRISGGAVDFALMPSTTGGGPPHGQFQEDHTWESSVDDAIAICGGDPRAAIQSLLVLTEFLEAEAEKKEKETE